MDNMDNDEPIIHVISNQATKKQIEEMASFYKMHIKLAVDVRQKILAGGGEWHTDCEQALIKQGSKPPDIWGGGYKPATKEIDYYALINIRPEQNNPDQAILSSAAREQFKQITLERLKQ